MNNNDYREKHYQWRFDELEKKLELISSTLSELYERLISKQDFYYYYLDAEKRKFLEEAESIDVKTKLAKNLLKWGGWLALIFVLLANLVLKVV